MRSALFGLIALFAGCSSDPPAASDAPPDAGWQPANGAIIEPIDTLPHVTLLEMGRERVVVNITNIGSESLEYEAMSDSICTFREIQERGNWIVDTYDWCGMGVETATLEPGQTIKVLLKFRPTRKRERLLASFRQFGTEKQSYVILACEPTN